MNILCAKKKFAIHTWRKVMKFQSTLTFLDHVGPQIKIHAPGIVILGMDFLSFYANRSFFGGKLGRNFISKGNL